MPQIHAPPDAHTSRELVRAGMNDPKTLESLATAARIALRRWMNHAPQRALEQAVEEVVSETTEKAWAKADTYDPNVSNVRTWMRGYLNNFAMKRLDRTKRRKTTGLPFDLADPSPSAEERFLAAADKDRLRSACAALDPLDRRIVELHLDGKEHAEIAAALGITDVNSRVRVCRVKDKLIELLSPSKTGGPS